MCHCGAPAAAGTGVLRTLVAADRTGEPVRGPRAVEAGKAEIPEGRERRRRDVRRQTTGCVSQGGEAETYQNWHCSSNQPHLSHLSSLVIHIFHLTCRSIYQSR